MNPDIHFCHWGVGLRKFKLNQKLLVIVVACSSLATTLGTIMQLSLEYVGEKEKLDDQLLTFEKGAVHAIRMGLWDMNDKVLETQIASSLGIKELMALTVKDSSGQTVISQEKSGPDLKASNLKTRNYQFNEENGKSYGSLTVTYTEDFVISYIRSRVLSTLAVNFLKTLLVSGLLLSAFSRLVVNPVLALAGFFGSVKLTDKEALGKLGKIPLDHRHDELHDLHAAIGKAIEAIQAAAAEAEAQRLKAEDERTNSMRDARLAEIGVMAGGVAHEINSPLAVILGRIELMEMKVGKDPSSPLMPHVRAVQQSVKRIDSIIKGLLTVARDGSKDPFEGVTLRDLFGDVEPLTRIGARRLANLELTFSLPEQDVKILCRRVQVAQVLVNLINNAIDAVETLPTKWVKVVARQAGNQRIEISVVDSGGGISKEVAAKMFLPFFTTKVVGKGTGLGLSIALSIVKEQDGTLRYQGDTGHTTFVVDLPAAA